MREAVGYLLLVDLHTIWKKRNIRLPNTFKSNSSNFLSIEISINTLQLSNLLLTQLLFLRLFCPQSSIIWRQSLENWQKALISRMVIFQSNCKSNYYKNRRQAGNGIGSQCYIICYIRLKICQWFLSSATVNTDLRSWNFHQFWSTINIIHFRISYKRTILGTVAKVAIKKLSNICLMVLTIEGWLVTILAFLVSSRGQSSDNDPIAWLEREGTPIFIVFKSSRDKIASKCSNSPQTKDQIDIDKELPTKSATVWELLNKLTYISFICWFGIKDPFPQCERFRSINQYDVCNIVKVIISNNWTCCSL